MRRKNKTINSLVLSISIILAMSIIGASYATWSNGLNVSSTVATGYFDPKFSLKDTYIVEDDGEIELDLSSDGRTLHISGVIYPSFNKDIKLQIMNEGTFPVVLKDKVKDYSQGIEVFNNEKYKDKYLEDGNIIDNFMLNINPSNTDEESYDNRYEFNSLMEEIEDYSNTNTFEFEYEWLFEQGY